MFLIAGEALIDMVSTPQGTYLPVPGGAPFNFARALALQNIGAGYLNPFSDDAFGTLLKRTLEDSGAVHLGHTSQRPTSLALVTTDHEGHPHYSFYRADVADRDFDEAAAIDSVDASRIAGFHTGALALVPPDHERVLQAARRFRESEVLCTLDVNMRPQVAASQGIAAERYRAAALEMIACADVVKVSDEDLLHLRLTGQPGLAARTLLEHGPRLVVLTLGASGAWAISAEDDVFHAAHHVEITDTVGAGDCFFAGLIASLHHGIGLAALRTGAPDVDALEQALAHATACAAINISRQGCQPPTWDEARAWQGQ
jgi:fructokinase